MINERSVTDEQARTSSETGSLTSLRDDRVRNGRRRACLRDCIDGE